MKNVQKKNPLKEFSFEIEIQVSRVGISYKIHR